MNPNLYLIDASGLIYRAYYALGGLATSDGQPTGAIFGFVNILNKILKKDPEYIACCFDLSRETFRQKKFLEYKIQRPPMPDELVAQIPFIKEIVLAYNIASYELKGYEADDLISSLTKSAGKKSWDTVIVSSDKDILQLVGGKVKVFDPKRGKEGFLYDEKEVLSRFGIKAKNIIDMLSLMGDVSDNIPGVPGVGEKTAVALINEFDTVDNLLKNINRVKSPKLREAVRENADNIRLGYDLITLREDLDIDFDLEKLKSKPVDSDKLFSIFKKLEFNSFIKTFSRHYSKELELGSESPKIMPADEKVFARIEKNRELFLFCDGLRTYLSDKENIFYAASDTDARLRGILGNPDIKKIGHNLKYLKLNFLKKYFIIEGLYFDTQLAAYLIDSSLADFSLGNLAFKYLNAARLGSDLIPQISLDIIIKIKPLLEEKLKELNLEKTFAEVEMPLATVLAEMEYRGVGIDVASLKALSVILENKLIGLRNEIYKLNNNEEFNLNSPRQLAGVLFGKLGLKVIKKTKTGPSTDEEVLRKLSSEHKIPELILEHRSFFKLKSTYVDSLPLLIDERDQRVHTTFDQTGTETGRFSSSSPNLQNIPVKGEVAFLIRKSFIAQNNWVLISADYSQIDLRVLAHFSADDGLINAFNNGRDIHAWTASLIFGVEESGVSQDMREIAKRINFGIVYGMSSFGLSKDLNIPQGEAAQFIEAYFLRYPKVKAFIQERINLARALGYAMTLLGRRRILPGINSENNMIKGFAERQAVNSVIQGSSADIIKLAMVGIFEAFAKRGFKAFIIMQIHDELVFDAPESEAKEIIGLVRRQMENVYKLKVGLKVNIKQGKNWQEMETV